MALSDEQILELAGLAPNRRVCASTCMTRKIDKKPCQCFPGMRNHEALALARAIEAEARRDALEKAETACAEISVDYWMGDAQFEAATRCRNAIRKLKEDTQ